MAVSSRKYRPRLDEAIAILCAMVVHVTSTQKKVEERSDPMMNKINRKGGKESSNPTMRRNLHMFSRQNAMNW
jgi:hypothetical protein